MPILPRKPKAERLEKRAEKTTVKANAALSKAKNASKDRSLDPFGKKIDRKYNKAGRLEDKAFNLSQKATRVKKDSEVNAKRKSDMAAVKSKYSKKK